MISQSTWDKISRGFIWTGKRCVLSGIILCIVVSCVQSHRHSPSNTLEILIGVAAVLFIGGALLWYWPYCYRYCKSTWIAIDVAATPIPNAHEIYEELTAYYGRPATIEEVAAAQSIYAHNRNEAAAQAALGLGAFLLITGRL